VAKLDDVFKLMSSSNLDLSTHIGFRLGKTLVRPDVVDLKVEGYSPKSIMITVSDEYVESLVQRRMKEMFGAMVDKVFEKTEVASG